MSVSDTDSECGALSPSNPEEQPLAVAGKSFSELLEDQIHQENHETFSTQSFKVNIYFLYDSFEFKFSNKI